MGSNPIPLAILLIPIIIPATTHADAEAIIIYADGRLEHLTGFDGTYYAPSPPQKSWEEIQKDSWETQLKKYQEEQEFKNE